MSPIRLPPKGKHARRRARLLPALLLARRVREGQLARRFPRRPALAAAGFVASLLALVLVVTGVTFGRFNSGGPRQTNTFSSGTVTLLSGGTSGTCTATALVPNGVPTTCSLKVSYTGSIPGWLGLGIFIATTSGSGGENLYNPSATDNHPIFSVADTNSVAYTLPTAVLSSCPSGPYSTYNRCYQTASPLLVSTAVITTSSPTVTFTVSITIPTNNASAYQGGTAAVVITAQAVQASNNGSTTGCTPGSNCPSITSWS
jgi:hypothetical protein